MAKTQTSCWSTMLLVLPELNSGQNGSSFTVCLECILLGFNLNGSWCENWWCEIWCEPFIGWWGEDGSAKWFLSHSSFQMFSRWKQEHTDRKRQQKRFLTPRTTVLRMCCCNAQCFSSLVYQSGWNMTTSHKERSRNPYPLHIQSQSICTFDTIPGYKYNFWLDTCPQNVGWLDLVRVLWWSGCFFSDLFHR